MQTTNSAAAPQVNAQNADFLKQRKLLLSTWRSIGPVLAAGILVFYVTVWFAAPILVNPFAVMNRLQQDDIDITTLQTMAVMLPLVTTLLCLALLGLIAHVYRASRIERRYRALIEKLDMERPI